MVPAARHPRTCVTLQRCGGFGFALSLLGDRVGGAGRARRRPSPTPSVTAAPGPGRRRPVARHRVVGGRRASPAASRRDRRSRSPRSTAGADGFVAVGCRDDGADRDGLIWFSDRRRDVGRRSARPARSTRSSSSTSRPRPMGSWRSGSARSDPAERPHAVFLAIAGRPLWERLGQVPGSRRHLPGLADRRSRRGSWRPGAMPTAGRRSGGRPTGGPSSAWRSSCRPRSDGHRPAGRRRRLRRARRSRPARRCCCARPMASPGRPTQIDAAADVVRARGWSRATGAGRPGRMGADMCGRCLCPASAVGVVVRATDRRGRRLPARRIADRDRRQHRRAGRRCTACWRSMAPSAWASPDGWAWRPLPEPGDGSMRRDRRGGRRRRDRGGRGRLSATTGSAGPRSSSRGARRARELRALSVSAASIARTLSSRRWWRGSPLNVAPRNATTHSKAGSGPIDPGAQRQDVHVVVLDALVGGVRVVADRRPDRRASCWRPRWRRHRSRRSGCRGPPRRAGWPRPAAGRSPGSRRSGRSRRRRGRSARGRGRAARSGRAARP